MTFFVGFQQTILLKDHGHVADQRNTNAFAAYLVTGKAAPSAHTISDANDSESAIGVICETMLRLRANDVCAIQ